MGLVRPLQVSFVQNALAPPIIEYSKNYKDVDINVGLDEIWMLPQNFPRVRFDLPFGGFFLLPLTLFIAARKYRLIKPMCLYHAALILVFPFLGALVFNGFNSISALTILHEKVYKALFIILGLLAVRESAISLKDKTE